MILYLTIIGFFVFLYLMTVFFKMNEQAPFCSRKETVSNIFGVASAIIPALLGIAMLIMLLVVIINNSAVDAKKTELIQKHDIMVYQLENNLYDNDNDLGKKELFNDISAYNATVAKGKTMQRDFWLGPFYPNIYDDLELIDYK